MELVQTVFHRASFQPNKLVIDQESEVFELISKPTPASIMTRKPGDPTSLIEQSIRNLLPIRSRCGKCAQNWSPYVQSEHKDTHIQCPCCMMRFFYAPDADHFVTTHDSYFLTLRANSDPILKKINNHISVLADLTATEERTMVTQSILNVVAGVFEYITSSITTNGEPIEITNDRFLQYQMAHPTSCNYWSVARKIILQEYCFIKELINLPK